MVVRLREHTSAGIIWHCWWHGKKNKEAEFEAHCGCCGSKPEAGNLKEGQQARQAAKRKSNRRGRQPEGRTAGEADSLNNGRQRGGVSSMHEHL